MEQGIIEKDISTNKGKKTFITFLVLDIVFAILAVFMVGMIASVVFNAQNFENGKYIGIGWGALAYAMLVIFAYIFNVINLILSIVGFCVVEKHKRKIILGFMIASIICVCFLIFMSIFIRLVR